MSKQRVPEAKRWEIVDLYANLQLPPKHIVRATRVPRRTVFAILRKWKLHGDVADLPRSGRPRKTTPKEDRRIVRRARRFPFETPRQVINVLQVPLSTRTVRRRLREAGIRRHVARYTLMLNPVHIAKRLAWCLKHRSRSRDEWRRVIWSDERNFYLGRYGRVWVSRPRGKRNHPRYTRPSESGYQSVTIWAYVDGRGGRGYQIYEGTIRSPEYIGILRRTLLPYARKLRHEKQPFEFMQDLATPHTATGSKEWLKRHKIPVLQWLPKGADLNPIENLWSVLAAKVQEQQPRNIEELKAAIKKAWHGVDRSLITKMIDSVPRRVNQVIQRRGYASDY